MMSTLATSQALTQDIIINTRSTSWLPWGRGGYGPAVSRWRLGAPRACWGEAGDGGPHLYPLLARGVALVAGPGAGLVVDPVEGPGVGLVVVPLVVAPVEGQGWGWGRPCQGEEGTLLGPSSRQGGRWWRGGAGEGSRPGTWLVSHNNTRAGHQLGATQ